MNSPVSSIVLLSCLIIFSDATALPDFLKLCKASDPNVGACIKESAHGLRSHLAEGVPEMNISPLEPFTIGDSFMPHLNLTLTDMVVNGITHYEIEEATADLYKYQAALLGKLTNVNITSKYSIDTKLVAIPLRGKGTLNVTFGSLPIAAKVRGKPTKVEGKSVIDLKFTELKIGTPTDVTLKLEGLFPENKELAKAGHIVIQENALVLIEDVIQALEPALMGKISDVTSKMSTAFGAEELYPRD